ncbi:MAG: M56 family metallopeptidase [Oscillibacter sp.]|uniref:M56 family metallopeptidase n=1 Tax=Oscillibacter sp. TaxID=1945593 RepID=UPI0021701A3E|nr:M56 family metallopeptidase [Oscillibacter sp.]MCI9112777.1 M56 family metallopeptidase [Oscillibacter sp.]
MKEILLTSSALILALLALRRLFRKVLSRRAQYALWGLVLLRLLVPASLPAAEFSLLTAAEPVVSGLEGQALYLSPSRVTLTAPEGPLPSYRSEEDPKIVLGPPSENSVYSYTNSQQVIHEVEYARQIVLADQLPPIWHGGMAAMACWLVLSNLLFWRKLRRARRPYPVEDSPRRVYLVEEGLPSPCLFGLFRPAIYLTPAALQSPDRLRHVLAHEETHARHLDPLWSLLRAVCLTVYWFDPLVWWAALASRTDCELACDEGALRRLGEAERVPYGRTLLSLIPVRKTPANPLLSATTMTAGKRQLKDRITRVAENPVYLGRALFAAVALAALVCAVTFTGAKTPAPEPARFHDVDEAVSTLAEELENYGGPDGGIMSKLVVYTPENPSEFFDLEEGELLRVYWGSVYLLSSNLEKPMGWLCSLYRLEPETNYLPRNVEILGSDGQYEYAVSRPDWAPELKRGETTGMSLMNQVISRIQEAVLSCESLKQVAQPDWDAAVTIPLDGLEPYEPQEAEALPFPYGSPKMLGGLEDPDHVLGDYGLMFFEGGGRIYAGVQHLARSSFPTPFWSFLPGVDGNYSASLFRNLLGHDGFCITYNANDREWPLTNEYYYLNEEGWPVLLARMEGYTQPIDLDGDGVNELVSQGFQNDTFYFRRDGKHYKADLPSLLWTVWPEGTFFRFDNWDPATRSMPFRADDSYPSDADFPTPVFQYRTLYFDGENLLIYNDQRHFSGHFVEWPDEPSPIIDAALTAVEERFHASRLDSALFYDDWRITNIGESRGLEVDGKFYVFRQVSYEFHMPELQDAPALGEGVQDHWAAPSSENLYLLFLVPSWNSSDEISYTDFVYLYSFQQEGSLVLSEELVREKLREMPPSDIIYLGTATLQAETSIASAANLAQAVMDRLMEGDTINMTLLASEGGGRYDVAPQALADWIGEFTDRYHWSYAEDPGSMPAGSLLMMSPGGELSLRFWPESELVLLNTRHLGRQESVWLRAEPTPGTPSIFHLAQSWYEIAEGQSIPIQETLDEILSDGAALFSLFTQGEENVKTRTVNAGQLDQAAAFTENYEWALAPGYYSRSPDELELSSPDRRQSFSFNPHNTLVGLRQNNQTFWFRVQPKVEGPSIYDFVYEWYEAAD